MLGSVCQTLVPLIERQIVDGVILSRRSAPLAVVGCGWSFWRSAAFGFAYIRRYRGGRVALAVQYDLRNDMHDHLQSLDFDNLNRMPTGQLVARANSDADARAGPAQLLPDHERQPPADGGVAGHDDLPVAACWPWSAWSWRPALLFVSYRMRWRVFPATWDGQQREGDVAQIVDEDVNGVRVVKAFGQEQAELATGGERGHRSLYGSQMRAVRLQSRYQPLLEAIPTLGQVGHPGLRRLAGPAPRDHARDVPRLFDLHRPDAGARPASWPAC